MSKDITDCHIFAKAISDYIDNEITENERSLLLAHIEKCNSCSTELKNLIKIKDMVRLTVNHNYTVDLTSNIMSKIKLREFDKKIIKQRSSSKLFRFFAVAAVTVFVLGATILYSQNESKKLLAQKTRFDSYAVEHSSTIIYDEPMVQSANYSQIIKEK